MPRYFITLSFNGTNYHGWQIQKNAYSVQAELNDVLSKLIGQSIEVTGAGRTDTGVHALEMVAHVDLKNEIEKPVELMQVLNGMLPKDIAILGFRKVRPESHARFDAISRSYVYKMHARKDPFKNSTSWFYPYELDFKAMNEACKTLFKYADFGCFSKSRTQTKTNLCKITNASWGFSENTMSFTISADRFLRNMVRAIVGTMIEIGRKNISLKEFEKIIQSGDRRKAGFSVPAHGLYLTSVKYPEEIYLD